MNKKLISLIGMSKKAGKLAFGFDWVKNDSLKGKIKLILMTSDLSLNSKKAVDAASKKSNTPLKEIPLTMKDISDIIGKETGILGIMDQNFTNGIMTVLSA